MRLKNIIICNYQNMNLKKQLQILERKALIVILKMQKKHLINCIHQILYIKYRNLVAVTTFIEYLESGRCKSLYGYTGCYNVYEQELRQNTIIGKLDQVLIQLDQIKKVQFATYLAIQQSNALQSSLLNTCNQMLDASTKEAALLEAQAQDNKIIKRNSEIISTISALNYIKNQVL